MRWSTPRHRRCIPRSPEDRTRDDDGRAHDGGCRRDAPRPRTRHARPGPRREPARRLRDPLPARRRARRGLAPRRRHRPRRGRRAREARAGRRRGRHRRRHPRAVQPHGPHRPVRGRPHRRRNRPGRLRGRRPRRPLRGRRRTAARRRRRGHGRRARRRGRGGPRRLAVRRPAPPAPRDREVGGEPRRPRRGIRRHEPVDHRPGRARRRAPTPRRRRRDRGRHRHRARRRPRAHGARPRRRVLRRAAGARGVRAASPCPPMRRSRGIRTPPSSSRAPTSPPTSHELQRRGIRSLFVEGGPTLASAFLAAGLVDELLVYLAPALLGGPRLAVGDLGIATIADARRFDFAAVERLGDDLLVVARSRTTAPKGTDMFTGIIEELGTVTRVERSADAARLTVRGPLAVRGREARRLDRRLGRVPHRRRLRRRVLHRRRHGADARDVHARRRRARASR